MDSRKYTLANVMWQRKDLFNAVVFFMRMIMGFNNKFITIKFNKMAINKKTLTNLQNWI